VIILSAAQVAALVVRAGFPDTPVGGVSTRAIAVAICRRESGYRVDALDPNSASGLFKIRWDGNQHYDQRRLLSDPEYNTNAAYEIYQARGLQAWISYATSDYVTYLGEARLALAQAATALGAPELPSVSTITGASNIGFGPLGTPTAPVATLVPAAPVPDVLDPIKIIGSEMWGDYTTMMIGTPEFEAGLETIPNLRFTIVDPEGELLSKHRNVFVRGSRVQYLDLDLRIDQVAFEPGSHGSGQLIITAMHDIAYRLMILKGAATASGVSATQWLARELATLGFDPALYMIGEALVDQAQVSRDVDDQQGSAGSGQAPSGWTTMTRLARELGKRFFLSGGKAVFGSSAFAMRWCAYGSLRLSWYAPPSLGEQWLSMPSARTTSVGDRANVAEVVGKIPLNRAKFFRPGVSVIVRNTPTVAGDEWREFICSHVAYSIGTDIDGAEITLLEPVDPPPQPPQAAPNTTNTSAGTTVSGGGADGQVDRFVAIALQQAGDRYVFGAEAAASNPNPAAFDCCIVGHMLVYTANRGPVPVDEIEIGDMVYGCDLDAGNGIVARPVVAWARQRARPIYRVRTRNREIDVTGNHPFLRAVKQPRHRDELGQWQQVHWTFEWTNAQNLTRGDLAVTLDGAVPDPVSGLRSTLPDGAEVTDDIAWLFGAITGNGWITHSGVVLSVFKPDVVSAARKTFEHTWGRAACWYPDAPERGVIFNSVTVAAMLRGLGCVGKSPVKRVPPIVSTWRHGLIAAYLRGFADTDGHYDKRGHVQYGSSSRRLLTEVRALHIMIGDAVSNITSVIQKDVMIRGKAVSGGRRFYSFAYYPNSPRRDVTLLNSYGLRRFLPEPWSVRRVQSITEIGEDETFDIQVEGTRNFIAEGLCVSNSELVEWAASRAGISPKVPDGSAAQLAHCRSHNTLISVSAGVSTKGALLFHPGHVAISLGNGKTIEAANPRSGVLQGNANGRGWSAAGKIPGAQGYR
jgi:hypothetical protein